jgi:hypothetical protein
VKDGLGTKGFEWKKDNNDKNKRRKLILEIKKKQVFFIQNYRVTFWDTHAFSFQYWEGGFEGSFM